MDIHVYIHSYTYIFSRLWGGFLSFVFFIFSATSTLNKARNDWVGKVIHWEMCKKFQFDPTNKWYMHNPAPVLENDRRKLL